MEDIRLGEQATHVQCSWCGYQSMHYSGSAENPDEVLGEMVKCDSCGRITDYYEAHKKWQETAPETMTREQLL